MTSPVVPETTVDPLHLALGAAVVCLLRPLARVLIEHGIPFDRFAQWAKQAFVQSAQAHFALPGRKLTGSRIAVLTGLTRKDVARLAETEPEQADRAPALSGLNRAARVISGWRRELQAMGRPESTPIPIQAGVALDENVSLADLVRRFSGDMPLRAVLDELERSGAIERKTDRVALKEPSYVPEDQLQRVAMLGTDTADLIATIGHNLRAEPSARLLQRKVVYDNIPADALATLRQELTVLAKATLAQADDAMSRVDRDATPGVQGEGRKRAMLGLYYFESDFPAELAGTAP
jgi:hypothetical protein